MARPKSPEYRKWENLPKGIAEVAKNRTDYLLTLHVISMLPLNLLLANAYLQGIADATETMKAKIIE